MQNKRIISFFCLIFLLAFTASVLADEKEEAAIKAFFQPDEPDYKALFSPGFLKAIPVATMEKIRRKYLSTLGEFQEVAAHGKKYELRFAKGTCPSTIHLGADGKIIGFWLGQMRLIEDSLSNVFSDLKKLDGAVSVTILCDGRNRIAVFQPDLPLAVGSTFKLYVLEALEKKMKAEKLGWDAVTVLNQLYYSLPSGFLHRWPVNTPLTLQTLAHLMISISDNTATDHLLFYVGREAVESAAPARVRPFYSTAEMFRLKHGMEAKERERYLAADLATQREVLAGLSKISLEDLKFQSEPSFIDTLEWIITTRELCDVIYRLRESPSLRINAGLADKENWQTVGYKGGSEPGVLNQTYLLKKDDDSPWYSISVTINNPDKKIDEENFNDLIGRLIGLADADKLE